MKEFEMKKEWFEETDNTNRYVIKFGEYYFYEAWDCLNYMNLNVIKRLQGASWLTEEKATEISKKFGGEICKLNVEVKIVEEEK